MSPARPATLILLAALLAFILPPPHVISQQKQDPPPPRAAPVKNITREDNLRLRYQRGRTLDQQGRWTEALQVFQGILKEEPQARGSLLMAGIVLNKMARYTEAVEHLEKFRKLEPKDFRGIVHLIQAKQALKDEAAVAELKAELIKLRNTPPLQEGLADSLSYRRERIPLSTEEGGPYMAILEFFNPELDPFVEWFADIYNGDGILRRRLVLAYETQTVALDENKKQRIRTSDAMILGEVRSQEDVPKEFIIYERLEKRPTYAEARRAFLQLLRKTPEPIATVTLNP
jgi:tetratricopeptide (TPR) repeat protein